MTTTDTPTIPRHCAKWSPPILRVLDAAVEPLVAAGPYLTGPLQVLDPFAGVSEGIHRWSARWPGEVETVGVELEPEWAAAQPGTIAGNATELPVEWSARFDVVATSPCYGNRMADHHEAADPCKACGGGGCVVTGCTGGATVADHRSTVPAVADEHTPCKVCKGEGLSRRNTYRHALGRMPSPGSAATLQWSKGRAGNPYRRLHVAAWEEVTRCAAPSALWLLNVSNHVRVKVEQRVVEWHLATVLGLDDPVVPTRKAWRLDAIIPIETQRNRQGENGDVRVPFEFVLAFRRN